MAHIDFQDYKNRLLAQGYPDRAATVAAVELTKVDRSLTPLVEKWLNGKEDEFEFECHGYSISGLMKSRHMTYPAALLTIDWLIKEPEKAKQSLQKGVR